MNFSQKTTLASISDIQRHFARNEVPVYFISASNFNMMGMHDWVRNWLNINLIDCFDGKHPQVLLVADDHAQVFQGIEDINTYLLNSSAVRTRIAQCEGMKGHAVFLFFDEQIEAMCAEIGLDILLPKNSLVREIDSKIVTTEIGNQAGVHSVPNALAKISSFSDLKQIAQQANLGSRWVVQTAYGDSGKTTFFIASEADYQAVADEIESQDKVKVMRWVNCTGTAIEACATRWGTFVGPLLTELIGIKSLTPYAGGWCGNELYQDAYTTDIRKQVLQKTQAMGDALYQRGYRGYFELDYLIDSDSGEVYLGELNARITGISAMTNLSDFSTMIVPLFLFHLLEYDNKIELGLDVNAFNQAVLSQGAMGCAAQVILKYTEEALTIVTQAPVSGVYMMGHDGHLSLKKAGVSRREAMASNEAYILRIMPQGDYAYHGGDLAIMFLNVVIRDERGQLNDVGDKWVHALKQQFQYRPLNQEERSAVELANNPANVKSGRNQ
ncbi:MAG: hypothetical protein WC736_16085 [Gallionella sp.]|jgi:hypothetical protein